jgi:hypothetical protein
MYEKNDILIHDVNYVTVESLEDEELYRHGIFEWNISKIIQYINENERDILQTVIDVKKHFHSASINESHVDTVNLFIPVIQAEINPGNYIVIDGHHRLAKAKKNNVPFINSYKLKVIQHNQFFTSIKSYATFVDYWNSKIRDKR